MAEAYGAYPNKSKAQVYEKAEADMTFATKEELKSYAKTNHASSQTTYGIGTSAQYGHVKVVDSLQSGSSAGQAFSAKAAEALRQRITSLESTVRTISVSYQVPVGHIAVSAFHGNPILFAREMGYGTWEYIGDVEFKMNGSVSDTCYGFRRLT